MALEKKKYTSWRKVLAKHGRKAVRNPLAYAVYMQKEYAQRYEPVLRSRLKKMYRKMFPGEII